MTIFFKNTPPSSNGDRLIATALNGVVYVENNRLHLKGSTIHYIYKFDGSPIGWYMRNPKTLDDIYLWEGAIPTVELESISVNDAEYWASIQIDKDESEL
jgi:hypothetical protein